MDYLEMTAPCGLACFNCVFSLARESDEARKVVENYSGLMGIPVEAMLCRGCRPQGGVIALHQGVTRRGPEEPCRPFACTRDRGIDFCHQCGDFPCDELHPYADRADKVPHNTKVYNLCLIRKLGLERWAEEKAAEVANTYFNKWWSL